MSGRASGSWPGHGPARPRWAAETGPDGAVAAAVLVAGAEVVLREGQVEGLALWKSFDDVEDHDVTEFAVCNLLGEHTADISAADQSNLVTHGGFSVGLFPAYQRQTFRFRLWFRSVRRRTRCTRPGSRPPFDVRNRRSRAFA